MIKYDKTFIVEEAIKNDSVSKDVINLYERLNIGMELMENSDEFTVVESKIDNGINFGITTRYPHGLPDNVGIMFFNIDNNYDVSIKETSRCVYSIERYYDININMFGY